MCLRPAAHPSASRDNLGSLHHSGPILIQHTLAPLISPSFIDENFCNRSAYRSLSKLFSCSNSLRRFMSGVFMAWLPLDVDRRMMNLLTSIG